MPTAAGTEGASPSAATSTQKEEQTALEKQASASQADTEPLSFDDDDDEYDDPDNDDELIQHADPSKTSAAMEGQAAQDALAAVAAASPLKDDGTQEYSTSNAQAGAFDGSEEMDAEGEEEDLDAEGTDDEDAPGEDEEETEPIGPDGTDSQLNHSLHTAGEASAGDVFSDDSELSDESDNVGEAEDDDDDDEMGDDDEEDDDADGEDDEEDDEDAEADEDDEDEDLPQEDDEDEAAEGLAALTSAQPILEQAEDAADAQSGLDSLAVLATAGADDSEQSHDESDTDSIASSRRSGKFKRTLSQPKASSRLKEVTAASSIDAESDASDADEDEDDTNKEEHAKAEDGEDVAAGSEGEADGGREMSSLGGLSAAAKKKAARSGPAAGLLAGAPAITVEETGSGAQSAATSREGSPKDDEDEERADRVHSGDEDQDDIKTDEKEVEEGAGTPAQEVEETALEEDPSTDEAAVKRQDAMDALTKIEIGFAILRDKLYVERMDEINKENEMILDGTHPDLLYLTNLIEARRERRLRLTERYFEQQQAQYERVAHTEEWSACNNWRNEVSTLRKKQMDDIARKRRKLDREKRQLDGPRPARRHQVFETELVRNPHYDEAQARLFPQKKTKRKVGQEIEDLDEMGAYVAYPDLRSAEEGEAWMDMERMGIQPDPRLMQGMPFYRMEEMGMEPNGMYVSEGYPTQQEMLGYGGAPPMQGMHDGPIMDRHFDAGPPPPGYLIDEYGNPLPHQMYGGQGPRVRDDDGMLHHQPALIPQNQASHPPPQRKAGGRKPSPGGPRPPKTTSGGSEDRHRKAEMSGNGSKQRSGMTNAQDRSPPGRPRPAPVLQSQQQHPHHAPPSLSHPTDMAGGMSHRPPAPGQAYMPSYGGGMQGGHMSENDVYYGGGGQGPPPGAVLQGPGAGHYQRGHPPPNMSNVGPGPNLPPLQPPPPPQRAGTGAGGNLGHPPSHFDLRRPPGEPMYSR